MAGETSDYAMSHVPGVRLDGTCDESQSIGGHIALGGIWGNTQRILNQLGTLATQVAALRSELATIRSSVEALAARPPITLSTDQLEALAGVVASLIIPQIQTADEEAVRTVLLEGVNPR